MILLSMICNGSKLRSTMEFQQKVEAEGLP